jgi:aminoglycoside 3-N-acetyltransferase
MSQHRLSPVKLRRLRGPSWASQPPMLRDGAALNVGGERRWVEFLDEPAHDDDFEQIGAAFTQAHPDFVTEGAVAAASCRWFPMRPIVDFATAWMTANR